jgi:hypothetical protein
MSYEQRNGKFVYYHKTRVGRRVVATYLGDSPMGEELDREVQARNAERLERREQFAMVRAQLDPLDLILAHYHNEIQELYNAWKLSEGYHRHEGRWRKTGKFTMRRRKVDDEEKKEIMRQIEAEKARREFANGNLQELLKKYNALPNHTALEALIYMITDNEHRKEAYRQQFKRMKTELLAGNESPIARLLAERVALTWIDVHHSDVSFYVNSHDPDLRLVDYMDRRRTRASRRLIKEITALADCLKCTTDEIKSKLPALHFISSSDN